jgi:hypothetical protein
VPFLGQRTELCQEEEYFHIAAMGRRFQHCPCDECRGNPVEYHTWVRHTKSLATGARKRWQAAVEGLPEAKASGAPQAAGEEDIAGSEERENSSAHAFAHEIVDLVARNQLTVQGAEACLQATSRHYQGLMPEGCVIPKTWYRCRKTAMDGCTPLYFTRDFCPKCDYLFEKKERECPEDGCGGQRYTAKGNSIRQAYYFDLEDKIRRLYKSKFTAGEANYNATRPTPSEPLENRELVDCWDASILEDMYHNLEDDNKHDWIYLAQSNDGVEVQKNVSYTPITAKVLNLPLQMRGT